MNEYVLVLDYNGEEFIVKKISYEDVGFRETYLDVDSQIIFRKERDKDIVVLDINKLGYDEEVDIIDLI